MGVFTRHSSQIYDHVTPVYLQETLQIFVPLLNAVRNIWQTAKVTLLSYLIWEVAGWLEKYSGFLSIVLILPICGPEMLYSNIFYEYTYLTTSPA